MKYFHRLFALAASALLAAALLAGCGAAPAASSGAAPASGAVASSEAAPASSDAAPSAAASSASSDVAPAASSASSGAAASSDAAAQPGTVQCVFTVTYADGSSEEFALQAQDGAPLADALRDAGLISEEEAAAGFVTTVNGVTADWDKDGAWWCLTDASGEMTAVGITDIALHDGDGYAFTYTAG